MRLARLVASPESFSSEGGAQGVDSGVETFVPPKAIVLQLGPADPVGIELRFKVWSG